jgi:hypothetical protein
MRFTASLPSHYRGDVADQGTRAHTLPDEVVGDEYLEGRTPIPGFGGDDGDRHLLTLPEGVAKGARIFGVADPHPNPAVVCLPPSRKSEGCIDEGRRL